MKIVYLISRSSNCERSEVHHSLFISTRTKSQPCCLSVHCHFAHAERHWSSVRGSPPYWERHMLAEWCSLGKPFYSILQSRFKHPICLALAYSSCCKHLD